MRALIVSGIWPPDVGGPASHAPEVADFLLDRGHSVAAVVTADREPAPQPYPVHWVSRRIPVGLRHAAVAAEVTRRAHGADVVYATSMVGRASLGASVARSPLVVKLVADEAYERSRRRGLFVGDLDEFQSFSGGRQVQALRRARDTALQRAAHVVCPSSYLAGLAITWGVPAERVTVLPNPAPRFAELPPRDELRARLRIEGPTVAFAGRITRQKSLQVALAAINRVDGVTFLVAGDGPELAAAMRAAEERGLDGRVRFLGPQSRQGVLELFAAADASLLSSSWENFPHTVVEALAVGAPVISTAVGGVAEVVRDGENGLLVPAGDVEALADALERFFADEELRQRLREGAAASVEGLTAERVYERLEHVLLRAAGP